MAPVMTWDSGKTFPHQLLRVLSDPGNASAIAWLRHGHAFAITDPVAFAAHIMPRFTRGKLASFQRQLNIYGFRKVSKGADSSAGALVYFHPAFKRGRPEMLDGVKRMACKGAMSLNRLRHEDVPYDGNVVSERTGDFVHVQTSPGPAAAKRKFGHGEKSLPKRRFLEPAAWDAVDAGVFEAGEDDGSRRGPGKGGMPRGPRASRGSPPAQRPWHQGSGGSTQAVSPAQGRDELLLESETAALAREIPDFDVVMHGASLPGPLPETMLPPGRMVLSISTEACLDRQEWHSFPAVGTPCFSTGISSYSSVSIPADGGRAHTGLPA